MTESLEQPSPNEEVHGRTTGDTTPIQQETRRENELEVARIASEILVEAKAELDIEDKYRRTLLMVRNELCFGGDWETAIAKIDEALKSGDGS